MSVESTANPMENRLAVPSLLGKRPAILCACMLVALPLLLVALVVVWHDIQEDERAVAAEHEHRAQVAALTVDAFLGSNLTAVHSLAVGLAPYDLSRGAEATVALDRLAAINPIWLSAAIVGPDGGELGQSSPASAQPVYIGDRPYFQQVMATGQPTVSDGVLGRMNPVPTVRLASPLRLRSGERGVLFATLSIDRVAALIRPQVETANARVVVVDRLGQVIVSPDADQLAPLTPLVARRSVTAALAGSSGSHITNWNGVESLIAYSPVPNYGWGVLLVEPTATVFAAVRGEAVQDLALINLTLLIVVGIAALFRRRLTAAFQAITHHYREIQQAVMIRDELLAGVSHDLRSPLAGIKLTAEVLRRRMQAGPPTAADELATTLATIEGTCRYMDDLISGLLDVAQLQMGQPLRLQRAPTDLVPLVAQVVAASQARTGRSGRTYTITYAASDALTGEWDAARLRRVVENLLDNAVKYSPAGGEIQVTLFRDVTGPAPVAVLTVADAGIGIPADDLPHVFERFRRGSNVGGIAPGTGIGLAGARQIIQQHGGTIEVASKPGQGTQVTIRLPLAPGPPQPAAAPDNASA